MKNRVVASCLAVSGFLAASIPAPAFAAEPSDAPRSIPGFVVDRASTHLEGRVGKRFFAAYFRFDAESSRYYEVDPSCIGEHAKCPDFRKHPHYVLSFSFRMPETDFVDERVSTVVDAEGRLLEIGAVPDCVAKPGECGFPVDRVEAGRIAAEAGLAVGLRAWEFSFHWHGELRTFV